MTLEGLYTVYYKSSFRVPSRLGTYLKLYELQKSVVLPAGLEQDVGITIDLWFRSWFEGVRASTQGFGLL